MKLYILTPVKAWKPWYDRCLGVIVRAETEEQARELAAKNAGDEGMSVWLNNIHTKCEELTGEGKAETIMINFANA